MTPKKAAWSYEAGTGKSRVVVYADDARNDMLTLRWRHENNWKKKTLGRVIETDHRGKITPDCESFAVAAANQRSTELATGVSNPATTEQGPTTIAQTEALITDPGFGKYPHRNPFRDELVRAIRFAATVWGPDTPWTAIEEPQWTVLLRRRLEGLIANNFKAVRATEITIGRLITAVRWLRRKKFIPRDAGQWPDEWKLEVRAHWKGVTKSDRDPQPERPRYTLAEYQRILSMANFDPRLFMLLRLSVGLRPGQVARARRGDLTLPPVDWQAPIARDDQGRDPTDYGTFIVYGAGKKGGATVDLTRGQRLTVEQALTGDGYLAKIDAAYQRDEVDDYLLFPSGYVAGRVAMLREKPYKLSLGASVDFTKTITGSWIRKNWRVAETRAGIEHQKGRATYGGRRLSVDVGAEMELSPDGLQGLGGWSDIKIPTEIYRENTNKAGRREARPVRARLLGEEE